VDLFYTEDIRKAADPDAFRAQKITEYSEFYNNPFEIAFVSTRIHDIIEPRDTRSCLIRSLGLLNGKEMMVQPKKHGNIPL
jgi:acetyl-CoA carboxylase carboxyltransferase component